MQSPLRYPGSKQLLVNYLDSTLKENLLVGLSFVEAYAGGASLSLGLLTRGTILRATLVERDPLLYAFWKVVASRPRDLARRIRQIDISLGEWKRQQRYLDPNALQKYELIDLATACLFLNRTSFSGILGAGPIGGLKQASRYDVGCRFNRERVARAVEAIEPIGRKLSVVYSDALKYLKARSRYLEKQGSIVYLDPPYLQQGKKLYRFHYNLDDHKEVASFIYKQPYPWIVSYDSHPIIHEMFAGQKIVPISLNYAVKQSRKVDELMIANIKLVPPHYEVGVAQQRRAAQA